MKKISQLLSVAAGVVALAFLSGCSSTQVVTRRGPDPDPIAYRPKNPNNVRIKVSLSKQQVYVMEGDKPLLVAATCVGTPEKPTPKGHFRVTRREKYKRSYTYGFWKKGDDIRPGKSSQPPGPGYTYIGYPMQYWVEFKPTYGFHLGYVWPVPRSHGCLRLHKNVAGKFFELAKEGTPIHIADTQPEDETIGRNVPRPSDYNDPDPPAHVLVSEAAFIQPKGPLLVDY